VPEAAGGAVRLTFLGGLGEIGRNCLAIEVDRRIVLVDVGVMFPDAGMPGVDLVLPDFGWLVERFGDVEGVVLTHGHEDHVGGLAYLLRHGPLDVYGSAFTLELARGRVEEAGLGDRVRFHAVADGERRQVGPVEVEFIPVTHSVPEGFALAIRTPAGVVFHSGDFKLDLTPIDGRRTDLSRIGEIARSEGIELALVDSTNAEDEGFTPSERRVGETLRALLAANAERRVIATCFASHVHRIQQLIDAGTAQGRRVATLGRSMARTVGLARDAGLLHVPAGAMVDVEEAVRLAPSQVMLLCTGSQGEAASALSLLASGDHRFVEVGADDVVVLSSHAIPGNEAAVSRVINGLMRRGAEVVHAGLAEVHASGHACRGELATLHSILQARHVVPVHGEHRHLVHHARLVEGLGLEGTEAAVCTDGDVLELAGGSLRRVGRVPAGYLYVDGVVGGVGQGVLRDRRVLAEDGVVMVVVALDASDGKVVVPPEIVSRGWLGADSEEEVVAEARAAAEAALAALERSDPLDLDAARRAVRRAVGRVVDARTKRRPMIVPVVLEA
jgi:ribonuclease J